MTRPKGSPPILTLDERQDGIHVRLTVGSASVLLRATPGGQRMAIAVDEGDGDVAVEWTVRLVDPDNRPPVITGSFVQSPALPFTGRRPRVVR